MNVDIKQVTCKWSKLSRSNYRRPWHDNYGSMPRSASLCIQSAKVLKPAEEERGQAGPFSCKQDHQQHSQACCIASKSGSFSLHTQLIQLLNHASAFCDELNWLHGLHCISHPHLTLILPAPEGRERQLSQLHTAALCCTLSLIFSSNICRQ